LFTVAPVAPLQVRVSSGPRRTVHDVTRATELNVNAGDGDDQLTSTLSRAAFFTVLTMRGQEGNDTLTGGAADERLQGGSGNDAGAFERELAQLRLVAPAAGAELRRIVYGPGEHDNPPATTGESALPGADA
jgi:RTX calcium-binding nonapeptide repeat (4 copies)